MNTSIKNNITSKRTGRKTPQDLLLSCLTWLSVLFTFSMLLLIIGYILMKGVPYLTPSLFSLHYSTENVSLLPALITTIFMVIISLAIAVPVAVFSAIYLVEYAKSGSRLVKVVRIMAETLAGIPSIIYGLFGWIFFVLWLGWGFSLLAGSFTLAIMIMPPIMRTTEESLKSVPAGYREGAFGLGTGKLRTIFRLVLPSAAPGIFSGIILATGRIVGETAALIYTAGTVADIPENVMASGRTLAVHMYALSSEGLYTGQAYATAVVLLVVVAGINGLSALAAKKLSKG